MINAEKESLREEVKNFIKEHKMVKHGDNVIAAFSGGADSCCLVHVLCGLQRELGFTLYAAHFNHMLRNLEAKRDMDFAKAFCEGLSVKLFVEKQDVAKAALKMDVGTEEAGRILRYNWFERLSGELNNAKIVTAHNKNDNAETILLNIIRGSGLDGLTGIKAERGRIYRPLLNISRQEIEKYLKENGCEFMFDSTNLLPIYTRNKVRLKIMPEILSMNPSFNESVQRLVENTNADVDFINSHVKKAINRAKDEEGLNIKKLKSLHKAVFYRVIKEIFYEKSGILLQKHMSDSIYELVHKGSAGKSVSVAGGFFTYLSKQHLHFEKESVKEISFCYKIKAGEKVLISETGRIVETVYSDSAYENCVNIPANAGDIVVRSRRVKDKVKINGLTKTVKKLLIEKHVPRFERGKLPLVEINGEIVFIPGVYFKKAEKKEEKYLLIKYIR